ncbi:MAG TPA: preprotein translocase subunit SecG [bacterium]|nr:preprotein translocase subunit SecG [bacterium]HOL48402.1 preprotein translocase subunit SecG [bacterium]HPQ18882.1 preprotein translocase subunit SecG [bacterium]
MLYFIIVIIHIIVAIEIIFVVLMQKTRQGGGLGGLLGGYSQTLFGAARGDILTKITTISAIVFMITSFLLTFVKYESKSVVKEFTPEKSDINIPQRGSEIPQTPQTSEEKQKPVLSDTGLREIKDTSVIVAPTTPSSVQQKSIQAPINQNQVNQNTPIEPGKK